MVGMMWLVAMMMGLTGGNPRPDLTPVVSKTIDGNTGLEIRQTVESTGRVTVEVSDRQVAIRREHLALGARVTLTGSQGAVTVVLDGQGVTVSGLGGERRLDQLDQAALRREQLLIGRSTVVRDARALLDRLDLRLTTATGSALLLTKILLGTMVGDSKPLAGYRSAIAARVTGPKILKAGFQKLEGPGSCWDIYEAYVSQIWNDFWECIGHNWDSWLYYACELKWLLQAEMAMTWLIACNGGLPVH
jgi:hypothetical protein